jgi:hypothetical protein
MIGTWKELLDFAWWTLTGREERPHLHLSLRPSVSALAVVVWAWASVVLLVSAMVLVGDVRDPIPSWVFSITGAIALLWAPTRYAVCATARGLRRFALIALTIGAPVWILPMPADIPFSPLHRFTLWALLGIATALSAPLIALPLRVLRPTFVSTRRSIND